MIFSGDLLEKVLDGTKTQTRRPVRDRQRFAPGKRLAVQPGRGQRGVGFIEIIEADVVPLGNITDADALAEGFENRGAFFDRWESIYGTADRWEPKVWRLVFKLVES